MQQTPSCVGFFSALVRVLLWGAVWLCGVTAGAQPLNTPVPSVAPLQTQGQEPSALALNQRKIVTFRTTMSGDSPSDRAALARFALAAALQSGGPGVAKQMPLGDSVRFELDGHVLFFLLPGDLGGQRPASMLWAAAQEVERRLQLAVDESREMTDPRRWAKGGAYTVTATVLAYVLVRLLMGLRSRLTRRMLVLLRDRRPEGQWGTLVAEYAKHARTVSRAVASAVYWAALLLVLDAWVTFVLHQFAFTRPWGEISTAWLWQMLSQFVIAVAGAVPDLLIAALIFVLARLFSRAASVFLQRVESGQVVVHWLDADTAAPTRRLAGLGIWLFALAMAYPYLPGAHSEAFKGVSVLAGLMLSLGASSVVGQALSGLSLMYSRSLRVGEYIKVGDTEGTVVDLGVFTTKVHTGLGEEVSLPNTVVFGQPIRNFSRLVQDGRFIIHTTVTIGYATPWRQVHAMLLEGAARTTGVASDPAPCVVQTALSDFYVEYRLCAQSNRDAPAWRAEVISQLHSNVQDVFNENGVQIMSPHYMADPPQPQVVQPGPWASQRPDA